MSIKDYPPVTASGITQLTGDVLAGPGTGSQAATVPALATIATDIAAIEGAELLTAADETLVFPNSRELLAGTNITFDDTTPGERTINASGSGAQAYKLTFVVDGGGSALTTGEKKRYISAPVSGTIVRTRLFADVSGSVVVDIWKDTYANFPPTVADTITASAKPTLSSAQKYEDTTLTGWTTSVTAGDVFVINIDSVSTITALVVEVWIQP